ncbi:MAG: pyridoxal phosphate-dependent aminotransferase [Planctomycetia bacterium]|nr:pyridoxal phosphate-dependent aminotransferase [Planctomycetia bacterium]
MIRVSRLADSVKPSATLAAGAKARELKAKGITVYDFSLGEPDFNTPKHICDAATEAMAKGQTHYTPAGGTAELKKAIAKWYGRTYGFECGPEHVLVSNGAKHSIHNALAATVGPGDEVIIPAPYWVSYSDLVSMTGASYVLVPTTLAAGFKMTPAQLKAAITPKTRLVMINSPSNPTGAVYTKGELEALVDVVLQHPDVNILSDEIYEQLCYGNAKPTCIVTLRPELRERTITISGASKSYAMTGWRIGWTVAPAHLVKAMDNVQSQETSCPSSVSQAAMVVALESPESAKCIADMHAEFSIRRDLVTKLLKEIPGLKVFDAEGAFYAFFDVSDYFGKSFGGVKVVDSMSFCTALLEQAHVNLVPGVAFGAEGFVRMSFATGRPTIEAGLAKLKSWLASAA